MRLKQVVILILAIVMLFSPAVDAEESALGIDAVISVIALGSNEG